MNNLNFNKVTALVFIFFLILTSAVSSKDTGLIFVSNEKSHEVMVIDPDTYEIIKSIKTSKRPRDLEWNSDKSKLYVACGDDDIIDVIDIETLEIVDQIDTGPSPEVFVFSPDEKLIYVSNEEDSSLGILDLEEGIIMNSVPTGAEPEGVITSKDGKTIYVTSEVADMVHVINADELFVEKNIIVGTRPRRFAFTPDEKELWVTAELSGEVWIIDTSNHEIIDVMKFLPPGFREEDVTPVGLTMNKEGTLTYLSLGRANHIAVVDTIKREVLDYILVGSRAWEVALTRDEEKLFVANGLSDDVTIINLKNNTVIKSIPVGRVPHTVVIDD